MTSKTKVLPALDILLIGLILRHSVYDAQNQRQSVRGGVQ